jgi:hypothetical protein
MYYYETRVGTFSIVENAGRWHVMFRGKSLSSCEASRGCFRTELGD